MGDHRVYRDYNYDLGNQLLILRTRIALTQIALAVEIGVHRRSVQNWESGESYPKAEMLQRLITVFLGHHAFTPGNEREEAHALWEQATQDGPHPLPAFDAVWFARTLAQNDERGTQNDESRSIPQETGPSAFIAHRSSFIDWGEAIAVPTLYGRAGELATLQQWVVEDRCRVVAIVGIGGMGKSSLAITLAHGVLPEFEVVLFRSLQNGPLLAELLDHTIGAVSDQGATPPEQVSEKIARLIQLLRERRCLLVLDNYESILQPGALTGTYRTGYAEYGTLLQALSEREHRSCLLLTSREKPSELGPLEGRTAPVRTLLLSGLDDNACQIILKQQDIIGTADDVRALVRLYGGNPLALHLVTEPIRELFGGDVSAFLAAGDAFVGGIGQLLAQQFGRSTPLEQAILYWLAIEREPVSLSAVLANLSEAVSQREVLVALESLRRRMLIERGLGHSAFTLQPVILEYVTDQLVEAIRQELVDRQPRLLHSHALIQATARDYVRRSQERLIATPLLERLSVACGGVDAVERQLLTLLDAWRNQPLAEQGYGPGNVVNLLRLRRGHLRGLDLARLAIRQAYLQGVAVQDTSLAGVTIQDSIFTETFDAITAVAVSSTGAYWAAASTRGEVRIWAAGAQALYRMWRAHTDMVWALAFSPDGHTLASGSWDGTVKLWDAGSGALRWLGRHTSHINSVAFAPDGNILASSGNDATVRLWDLRSGAQLQVLPHPGQVSVVTWSPDGRLFATGDLVGSIRLWELPQIGPAICVQTLTGHANWVDGLAFAPDGRTLASASWDGTVKLWDTSTHRSGLWPRGHPSSGDTSGQAAHNANVVGESLRQTLAGHTDQVSRVAWSPDGCILASSSRDQTIRLWDIESSSYRVALVGHSAGVKGLAFTPNSRSLLSGSEDGTLRVWDTASGQCIRVVQGYAASLYDLDWSPDGAQLVSGGSDTLVTIYDATGGTPPRVLRGHSGVVLGVGWSSDRRWLASSEWENTIRLWDPVSGASLQVLRHPDDPGNYFYGLAWSPDGQRLASATYRRGLQVFEFTAQHQRWAEREFPTWIRPVAWSPDGQQLAGGGDDGTLYVWDATDGTLVEQLAGHHSMITSVAWSPAGTRLASGSGGSAGGELFVWDTQRGERLRAFAGHPGIIYAVAWGSSEDVLISGGGNGNLRWWDVQSGTCVWVRQAHQGTVQALRRSPDGTRLASCGDDGAIILWNLRTGEQLQILRRDRPYERMDITGLTGLTEAQRASLIALGAVDGTGDQHYVPDDIAESIASASLPADAGQPTRRDRKVALGLPFQPTPFIGRDAELTEIARLLGDPACRLLTLLGPGGIGKTRLALAVAESHTAAFADGVAFVALAAVGTPNQIVSAMGDTLSLSFADQPNPTAHLLGELRERHMLLVLDNFEHLLDGADLVSDMLAHAPHLTVLVTSRERLNLQAEWLFDVDGLTYPSDDPHEAAVPQRLADLTAYSAVQLFVQRARQVQPGLHLSFPTLTTIVRICQQVAGMPLAIELAAAGVRTLPLAEIERQIRANLDVLATTHRDVPIRHRSMRAVFDHSWQLLSEGERALFSRLAVFRAGWTLAAAEQVADAALPALMALVDKSLVRQHSAEPHSLAERPELNSTEEPRFFMLEPIREYALEQLATSPDAETIRQRHAHYFTALAEAAAAEWNTPSMEAAVALQRREHDNMRAALQWACDTGNSTVGLQLALALWEFWRSSGYSSEGRAWLEQLLRLDEHPADVAAMAARQRALHAAAWLASYQHDFATATRLFEQSMALRRALGETAGETDLLDLLRNAARQARAEGHYRRARALLEDLLARHAALGDRTTVGSASLALSFDKLQLGLVLREQGEFVRAAALFEEALALHRAIGDRASVAFALIALGDVARDQGDAAAVREYCEPSLAILRELGMQWAIGFALNNLALAAYLEGELRHAFALVGESVALFRGLKDAVSLAEVLVTQGHILKAQGDAEAAHAALTEALRLALAVGPRLFVAAALEGLASVVVLQGHADSAAHLLAAASALRAQMGAPVRPADEAAVEQALATVRSTLGADAFAAVWAEAKELPLDQLLNTIRNAAPFDALGDRSGR